MSEIIISIKTEVLSIILNLISILFVIIGIFLLSWIKKRVSEDLNKTFVYFMIAAIVAGLVRVMNVLSSMNIIKPFIYETFMLIPAFFFLLALIKFCKSIKKINPNHKAHRVHHRSVRRRR